MTDTPTTPDPDNPDEPDPDNPDDPGFGDGGEDYDAGDNPPAS